MKTLPFSKIRTFVILFALLFLAGGIGYRLGERNVRVTISPDKRILVRQEPPPTIEVNFALFWDVWEKLRRYYVDSSALDTQKMVYGAISGMVAAIGDPYTSFLPPKENQEFKEDLGGAFEGIGAQLGLKDGRVIVVAPLAGMPAEKAGVRAGDVIVKVNGEETAGWSVPQAVTKIRGARGTSVTLTIFHEGDQEPTDVTIVRDTITVPSVVVWVKPVAEITEISGSQEAAKLRADPRRVAYLQLSRFGDRTSVEWDEAVADIARTVAANGQLAGLIFDLRNNPGGYLDGSVFVASEFLRDGIVVSQLNSDDTREDFQVNRVGKLLDVPLIVLINKGSASAAEIAAGALRDHKRATLVGETTFGKGSVQTPFELAGGSGVHITTGKWLLPSGESVHNQGVKPDVDVVLDLQEATADAQLAKAVELLLE